MASSHKPTDTGSPQSLIAPPDARRPRLLVYQLARHFQSYRLNALNDSFPTAQYARHLESPIFSISASIRWFRKRATIARQFHQARLVITGQSAKKLSSGGAEAIRLRGHLKRVLEYACAFLSPDEIDIRIFQIWLHRCDMRTNLSRSQQSIIVKDSKKSAIFFI